MAPRAYWRGYIRLSLVTFPVRVYAAITQTEKISLHQYDRETGERIHYQKVNEEGQPVPAEDIIKGYEYDKDSYVPLEDDDLEKLKLESRHTIDLVQFTELDDVDPIYFERSYYVAPDGDIATEAFLTVREALRKSRKAAVGQVVLSSKERIVLLRPCSSGLIMDTLRYSYEVREAAAYFEDIPEKAEISQEQLELASLLIDQKTRKFDPKAFKDHYQEGLMEIIQAKLKGQEIRKTGPERKPQNVVDIVAALKKSLEQGGGGKRDRKKSGRKDKATA